MVDISARRDVATATTHIRSPQVDRNGRDCQLTSHHVAMATSSALAWRTGLGWLRGLAWPTGLDVRSGLKAVPDWSGDLACRSVLDCLRGRRVFCSALALPVFCAD